MTKPETPREKLDVESSEERQSRLSSLLSNISTPITQSNRPDAPLNPITPMSNDSRSRPTALPESDALARARAFLPLFRDSNQQLLEKAAKDPNSVNMEKINGGQAVAMDLGLGVFDAPHDPTSSLGPIIDSHSPPGTAADPDNNEEDTEDTESDGTSFTSGSESTSSDEDEEQEAAPVANPSQTAEER
ncbi:uncharacterized protein I303_104706 [Kwoniella dejecticola CBS 10117]|uniref:Uncharacterized protein n=1 Tax=Kwoniella dejecticola CBS 10117 TaxID=1296121 RepID=A0A1A6A4K4_9TREE|nr:uncharacterized protein I303_04314 [Kwoniella dejecticola CBS 10117]OBR84987.1 hypothetical protein I303_04314 [Kwoniella dejecticola CBS 10117]